MGPGFSRADRLWRFLVSLHVSTRTVAEQGDHYLVLDVANFFCVSLMVSGLVYTWGGNALQSGSIQLRPETDTVSRRLMHVCSTRQKFLSGRLTCTLIRFEVCWRTSTAISSQLLILTHMSAARLGH